MQFQLRSRRLMAVAALMAVPAVASAQSSRPAEVVGALVVAHGGGPDWNAQVEAVVAEVELPGPVAVSYLMGPGASTHRFQDALAALQAQGATRVVVVPALVSSHSGHYEQIRWLTRQSDTLSERMRHHLHMAGIERAPPSLPVVLMPGMDDAPEVAEVLTRRALALSGDPATQALFLVGHGPNSAEDHAAWMANLRRVADTVRARSGFRSVLVGLVRDDAPPEVRAEAVRGIREMIELQHELTGRDVVVVPILVSRGSVSTQKLPRDLEGLPMVYDGDALFPDAGMARWIERMVRAAGTAGTAGTAGAARTAGTGATEPAGR